MRPERNSTVVCLSGIYLVFEQFRLFFVCLKFKKCVNTRSNNRDSLLKGVGEDHNQQRGRVTTNYIPQTAV